MQRSEIAYKRWIEVAVVVEDVTVEAQLVATSG